MKKNKTTVNELLSELLSEGKVAQINIINKLPWYDWILIGFNLAFGAFLFITILYLITKTL